MIYDYPKNPMEPEDKYALRVALTLKGASYAKCFRCQDFGWFNYLGCCSRRSEFRSPHDLCLDFSPKLRRGDKQCS